VNLIKTLSRLLVSKTARSTYTLFSGNTLDAFMAFLFTVFTFRLLSPAEFGIYSAINNFVILSFSILDIGISSALVNFISYNHQKGNEKAAKQYFTAGLIIRCSLTVIVSVLVILTAPLLGPRFFLTQDPFPLILAGLAILGLSLMDVTSFSLQAYQRFLPSALVSSSYSVVRVILLLAFTQIGISYDLNWAMIFTTASPVIAFLLGAKFLNLFKNISMPDKKIYRSLLSFSGWVAITKIVTTISGRIDIQLLLPLAGASATGTYSVAARVASFYSVIVASFAAVIAPKMASGKKISELNGLVKKAYLAIAGLIMGMILAIIGARPFILILFGDKAEGSIMPFRYLTLAFIPFVASSLAITILIYNLKKTKSVALLSLVQMIMVVSGNLILIPRFGIYGSVITFGFSNLIIFISSYIMVYKDLK
jgi:O-antigen/teichoic acid export membrane protein